MSQSPVTFFWFRRDLRLFDNAGLHAALQGDHPVVPLFIFDRNILEDLHDKQDARVEFIHQTLQDMQKQLNSWNSSLLVRHGKPKEVWQHLLDEFNIQAVYTNNDYEPYAKTRDGQIADLLQHHDVEFRTFKDQVIFEKDEVLKNDGDPYTVYTPYKNKWKTEFVQTHSLDTMFDVSAHKKKFWDNQSQQLPELQDFGFQATDATFPAQQLDENIVTQYDKQRDFPAIRGTTRMGVHLRFGTVSIRELVRRAMHLNETWLDELIWREFYMMILHQFPHVVEHAFREKYDTIEWANNKENFDRWCAGETGYPLVDAGMRELNETGFMHNRVRMVTASFLSKHLLIDWRWGERYFAEKLLDYELASNNGNWQWAAGTGCDAAPYFRIFNPTTQMKKFDPDLKYIATWVPEYGTDKYPAPMVDHKFARQRALDVYGRAVKN